LDAKQRRRYLETYTTWSVAHYAHRFDSYSGQRFEVLPAAEQNARTVTIVSRLISSDAEAVDFHYKLRSIGDKWQIVDIQIEGVSQLALTRGQFVGILSRGGFDALISKLTDKIKTFERPSAP
jgi:phospholipid transport system substrate-binding protein